MTPDGCKEVKSHTEKFWSGIWTSQLPGVYSSVLLNWYTFRYVWHNCNDYVENLGCLCQKLHFPMWPGTLHCKPVLLTTDKRQQQWCDTEMMVTTSLRQKSGILFAISFHSIHLCQHYTKNAKDWKIYKFQHCKTLNIIGKYVEIDQQTR
jgi:hypothetical protein